MHTNVHLEVSKNVFIPNFIVKNTARFICLIKIHFVRIYKFQSVQINFRERKEIIREYQKIWLRAKKRNHMKTQVRFVAIKRFKLFQQNLMALNLVRTNISPFRSNNNTEHVKCTVVGVKVSKKIREKRGKRIAIHHVVNNQNIFLY